MIYSLSIKPISTLAIVVVTLQIRIANGIFNFKNGFSNINTVLSFGSRLIISPIRLTKSTSQSFLLKINSYKDCIINFSIFNESFEDYF